MLDQHQVELAPQGLDQVRIHARCKTAGQTGVEDGALTAQICRADALRYVQGLEQGHGDRKQTPLVK